MRFLVHQTQEGLFRLDRYGVPVPALAQAIETSNSGLSIVTLRKGLAWSDGAPIRSQDFIYGWRKRNLNMVAQTLNDRQLRIDSKLPRRDLIQLLAKEEATPMRADFVEKFAETYATSFDRTVFSGPFTITSWVPETSFELKKNKLYWNQAGIGLNEVRIRLTKDKDNFATLKNFEISAGILDLYFAAAAEP